LSGQQAARQVKRKTVLSALRHRGENQALKTNARYAGTA
jgi:hypothetical protein